MTRDCLIVNECAPLCVCNLVQVVFAIKKVWVQDSTILDGGLNKSSSKCNKKRKKKIARAQQVSTAWKSYRFAVSSLG